MAQAHIGWSPIGGGIVTGGVTPRWSDLSSEDQDVLLKLGQVAVLGGTVVYAPFMLGSKWRAGHKLVTQGWSALSTWQRTVNVRTVLSLPGAAGQVFMPTIIAGSAVQTSVMLMIYGQLLQSRGRDRTAMQGSGVRTAHWVTGAGWPRSLLQGPIFPGVPRAGALRLLSRHPGFQGLDRRQTDGRRGRTRPRAGAIPFCRTHRKRHWCAITRRAK